jgi:hypothetical protein
MWFNQSQNQSQNQSDAHSFSCRAAPCRAVENQLFTPGAQGVALAGLHSHQHIRDPIQIPPVAVLAGPASLAWVPKQTVQELIGEKQGFRRTPDQATRRFQVADDGGQRRPSPFSPGLRRCRCGLPRPLATRLGRHGLQTALTADLSAHAAGLPEKLRNILWQFPNHTNGPLALPGIRRVGWVLSQRVAAPFESAHGMHQPVQDAIRRQGNPKTGRRGHPASCLPAHRFDESPDDYSLASCSPAELASASPSDHQLAIDRPAEPLLTIKRRVCILPRVSPTGVTPGRIVTKMRTVAR